MPTQPVFEFRPSPAKPARAFLQPSRLTGNVVSICESPAFSRVIEPDSTEPVRDGLGCARAIRAAHDGEFDLAEMGRRAREYAESEADRAIAIGRYESVLSELSRAA